MIFVFSSFKKREATLIGIWKPEYFDEKTKIATYSQSSSFKKKSAGIQFFTDGKLKVKQSTGTCGTMDANEKINYEIVEGTWTISSDSIIELKHPLWGQNLTEKYKLKELTENKLVVQIIGLQ
ncbi:hypothetical protein B0A65_13185 [Flavobacterium frigidimaris]|uniref:Lipocalin-like domain-containing protein n=2 Tax=Flavobacterium frigidimaris TaxID=262320 RepID=A0ABX4BPG1_FLAFR|nr:hypothetical protein B0A65_13185 [Flavobacterium frigidimaris]